MRRLLFIVAVCAVFTVKSNAAVTISYSGNTCPVPATLSFNYTCPLPGPYTYSVSFGDGPNGSMPFSHTYTVAGTYHVTAYIASASSGMIDTGSIDITISANCSTQATIRGFVYADVNANCVYDAGEYGTAGTQVHVAGAGTNLNVFTNSNGMYEVVVPGDSTYSITPVLGGATITCPATSSAIVTPAAGSIDTENIGFACNSTPIDLSVSLTGSMLSALSNTACYTEPVDVVLTLDTGLTYQWFLWEDGYEPAPDTIIGHQYIWHVNQFSSFFTTLQIVVDTNVIHVGDSMCMYATVTPVMGDIDLSNNAVSLCRIFNGTSLDPNYMSVTPRGDSAQGYIANGTKLTYTIHFQNTGTDTATSVYLMDTLAADMDTSTFALIASSSPVTVQQLAGGIVRFDFPGIQLPDSGANMAGSQGYVVYSMYPKSNLAPGTALPNAASIYFDANAPVPTNVVLNTIEYPAGTGIANAMLPTIKVYPNPATDNYTIALPAGKWQLTLSDMAGRVWLRKIAAGGALQQHADMPAGVYNLKVVNEQTGVQVVRKLVVE